MDPDRVLTTTLDEGETDDDLIPTTAALLHLANSLRPAT